MNYYIANTTVVLEDHSLWLSSEEAELRIDGLQNIIVLRDFLDSYVRLNRPADDLSILIYSMLRDLGIPTHLKGFAYFAEAIKIGFDTLNASPEGTGAIYEVVAQNFQTKPENIERAMRHAIEAAWKRKHNTEMKRIFEAGKPNNSELIATVTDYMNMLHVSTMNVI